MPSLRTLPHDLRMFAKYHLKRRVVDYPAPEEEMGVVSLGFDIDRFTDNLRSKADRFDIDELDTVTYQHRAHPILRLRSRIDTPAKTLLILSGVHGNEHAGLLAVPDILDQFDSDSVRLVVVAPVNPIGAAEVSRYNAEGYDINRDFVRFDTPEARAVRRVFDEEQPDFIVSLHEGPQDATFMFTNRLVDHELAARLLGAIEAGGTALATKDYFGRTLSPPGLAPTGRVVHALNVVWASTLRMKATGHWAEEQGVPEITLESSWQADSYEARVRGHVDLIAALVRELAAT